MGAIAHEPPGGAGLEVWRPAGAAADSWLAALVTTRHGGCSPPPYDSLNLGLATGDTPENVQANRIRLGTALGVVPEAIVTLNQVHGDRIWEVPDASARDGDGLWTALPGIVLAVGIADCVPVFVWDVRSRRIALVHAGWRGTAAGILGKALATLLARGSTRDDLRVALGPCIGPCCYVVSAEVAARFPAAAVASHGGALHLDLRAANRMQAALHGLAREQVDPDPPCTGCETRTFFSHRKTGPRTGRMWALAWVREPRAV